jgi:hypothetical protein
MALAIRWGVGIGLANLVWLYGSYWLGLHTSGVARFQWVPGGWFVLTLLGYVLAMRRVHAGVAPDLMKGLSIGGVIAVVCAVIAVLAQVGYFTVVHPEWPAYMVSQTQSYYEQQGLGAEEVATRVAAAREGFTLRRYALQSAVLALCAGVLLSATITVVMMMRYVRASRVA